MQPKWKRRLGLAAIFGAVGSASIGCAQERAPINRVQANALSKHFFVGQNLSDPVDDPEFYMRNTVIDVPYAAAQDGLFTASYAQPISRVKWEISENTLIGRQTYEHITDTDHNGTKRTNNGQVVAMFTIQSHFDIRRDYNPATGEELNVVTENSTDRPWYQREYMRVDWSKNQVTDGYEVDTLSQIGVFGGVKFDPMSYYVEDPNSPDHPAFDEKEGYFDVTTKAFATPQVIQTPFGSFPACFLPADYGGAAPAANCNPTEVTLRLSFKKVVNNDYEPEDWTGTKQEAFGWFTQERYGYERNYGILDEGWHRFASRYNIWEKSHVEGSQCAVDYWRDDLGNVGKYKVSTDGGFLFDPNTGLPIPDPAGKPYAGTPVGNGGALGVLPNGKNDPYTQVAWVHRDLNHDKTEDDCEFKNAAGTLVHPGSHCDEFTRKCALPLNERKIKTIPWYYGLNAPADLFPSTANALNQWNIAVKQAAQIGMMVEAKRVKADASGYMTDEQALKDDAGKTVTEVFVLCHNPTIDSDHAACFGQGENGQPKQVTARLGDIRYNSVNIINNPQTPSPWGIMVDADDPLTGEKVSTSVNEWGHVLDIASQGTEDLLRWINGEITDEQITSGKYLHAWATASQLGTAQHQAKTLDAGEIRSRLNSADTSLSKLNGLTVADRSMPLEIQRLKAAENLARTSGPGMNSIFEGSRQALIGTKFEAQMVNPTTLAAAGMDPATPVAGDDNTLAKASPLRGLNPGLSKWLRKMKNNAMAKHGSCMIEQPEPDSLVGMARQAMRLYPLPAANDQNYPALKIARDQALHQWIREQFHISVIAHEMGHSMGLRHNFTGTYDALNYKTQYWQLRTRNGKEKACTDAVTSHTNGEDCVGPRWVDPVTDAEVNGLIWKWGSTTVMDYPGDQTQDMNDIGPYDKAAMRFGYATVVDVDKDAVEGTTKGRAYQESLDGFGGIGGQNVGGLHYSNYNDAFKTLGKCGPQSDPNDALSAKCSGFDVDYVSRRDMHDTPKYGPQYLVVRPDLISRFAIDENHHVRHPYMFGSDEFADTGNVPVFRFDTGADSYEQFQFLISTYENRYIFDNFRRSRTTFSTRTQVNRAQDRYFDKIQGMTKSLALLVGLSSQPEVDKANPGGLMPLVLGASDGLAMFARIITRPEPGAYAIQKAGPSGMNVDFAELEDFNALINTPNGDFKIALGSGEGRYIHNDYDYSQGYYWADYQTQVGTAFEKQNATYYLTEAYNHFIANSKEDYVDGRYKNLNYASLYPNQMRRLFAQTMQDDPTSLGGFISLSPGTLSKDGVARVKYLPWEKYDLSDTSTTALDYSKDAVVLSPLVGWEFQYRALIEQFRYGSTTLTMDYIDQLRVYSPGGGDTISIDPKEQVRYRDPATGVEYVARTYGKEMVNAKNGMTEKSSGARMIQYANSVARANYVLDGAAPSGGVDPVNGELTFLKDSQNNPLCKPGNDCAAANQKLKLYSANLDSIRQLARALGYGPL